MTKILEVSLKQLTERLLELETQVAAVVARIFQFSYNLDRLKKGT